jgi:hypothetical protein
MRAELAGKAASGIKKTWSTAWNLAINSGRRAKILGRYGLACWQQQKLNRAMGKLGVHTFQALEQGEGNPLGAPEVNEAVQKAKELREAKDKNYQAMEAIRERIRASGVKEPPPPPPAAPPETPAEAPQAEPSEAKETEETKEATKPEEPTAP